MSSVFKKSTAPSGDLQAAHSLIRSVVIVDSPAITQPVGQFLRGKGWFVEEASNTGQARNLVSRFNPDFVITELLLPLESGLEFCFWLKQIKSRVATMIFSEIRSPEARNLAAWSGADAYLTKPTDPEMLYQQMLRAVSRVHRQSNEPSPGEAGLIRFRCKCGKRISAKAKYAGRGISCPGCSHLVRVPESGMDSSSYFKSPFAEKSDTVVVNPGVVCNNCGHSNLLSNCLSHGQYRCLKCRSGLSVSDAIIESMELFFGHDSPATGPASFKPLSHVFVQCEACGKVHEYFRNADYPQPCPNCGREHPLPSIRGVPISRAALSSTGRLFEFTLSSGKKKLFLLPSTRRYMIGSAPSCPFSLRGEPLEPQHCILKNTFEGPLLIPGSDKAVILVNGRRISGSQVLAPGDHIMLGGVALHLHGIAASQIQPTLDRVVQDVRGKRAAIDSVDVAKSIAIILQCHWQKERLRMIEERRNFVDVVSTQSSESSVMQQLSESGLHEIDPER